MARHLIQSATTGETRIVGDAALPFFPGYVIKDTLEDGQPPAVYYDGGESDLRYVNVSELSNPESAPSIALRAALVARDEVDDVVATALAADSAPAAAAAVAVDGALGNANVGIVLIEGARRASALTVVRGSPSFAAGKFGSAETGGALNQALSSPTSGVWTHEFWVRSAAHPGGNSVLCDLSGCYIGLDATGHIYLGYGGATGGPDICDNAWHHLALVGTDPATGNSTVDGLWVDGTRIVSAVDLGNAGGFNDWTFGGFKTSTAAAATAVSFDSHRASYVPLGGTPRYSGATFTPPTAAPAWDATTVALSPLDSLATLTIGDGYPPRPNVPAGQVTYIGTSNPTDMLVRDGWEQR